ncbi:hypothetical protein TNCV_1098061 [Trichonephila clavipes]|nr:hypothetical protein TNCV_1098061 [Trichonephila clavipes]
MSPQADIIGMGRNAVRLAALFHWNRSSWDISNARSMNSRDITCTILSRGAHQCLADSRSRNSEVFLLEEIKPVSMPSNECRLARLLETTTLIIVLHHPRDDFITRSGRHAVNG